MSEDADLYVISFGDADDDNEMLDLFSFGAETTTTTATSGTDSSIVDPSLAHKKKNVVDYSEVMKSVMPLPPSNVDADDRSNGSEDSFIELLEQQQKEVTVVDASSLVAANKSNTAGNGTDSDMQDILDWLDDDDNRQAAHKNDEEELIFVEPPRPPPLSKSIPKREPPPPPPKEYQSLEEAVKDPESTLSQIRRMLEKENFVVTTKVRPWLWSKVICGKTLEETLQSSIADSYQQWEDHWKANENSELSQVSLHSKEETEVVPDDKKSNSKQRKQMIKQAEKRQWLEVHSKQLATRIAKVSQSSNLSQHEQDLFAVLMNHEGSRSIEEDEAMEASGGITNPSWKDPLLPPIACVILSGGVPKIASAVMLSRIVSKFMPIVSLSTRERDTAGLVLHHQLYLLCGYHLPLLVLHLDKYLPGWYKWLPEGQLPQSWLISHMAGEAENDASLNPLLLLPLWDLVLTSSIYSLRYFLVLALLDRHAEKLLLLTDDDLKQELHRVVTFSSDTETDKDDGVVMQPETFDKAFNTVRIWSDRALRLWEETPGSVTGKLKHLEDEAVNDALVARQKAKQERLRLQQEAEAKAQQDAKEAEQEKRENEAKLRLTRARLVAFYRERNPGKETNIDKIMTAYEGRYDALDAKLKQKYGVGFNPALKPKPSNQNKANNTLLSSINAGFGGRRTFGKRKEDDLSQEVEPKERVVVEVSASEVLPIICWSKEANQIKVQKLKSSKLGNDLCERLPLKFYLVDCRPESSAQEQGRIPTSVALTPENSLDDNNLKAQELMFESLRGTVHICVMGEGYSSLPNLYGHKMTKGLAEFIKEDNIRTNKCAHFFLSRGFPFVSILEGGFAAAHAYLCREGPKDHLHAVNVLTDYDADTSIFAQFERANNATGREKAQRSLQHIFDSGVTALTKSTMRFEALSSEIGSSDDQTKSKGDKQNVVRRFFGGGKVDDEDKGDNKLGEVEKTDENGTRSVQQKPSVPFRNLFSRTEVSRESLHASEDLETLKLDSKNDHHSKEDNKQGSQHLADVENTTSSGQTSVPQKVGAFSGFSVAINNSIKSSVKTQSARNPFAIFSNPAVKNKDNKGPGMSNHFAGFNQLRKNMMKSGENKTESQIPYQPTVVTLPPPAISPEIGPVTLVGSPVPAEGTSTAAVTHEEGGQLVDASHMAHIAKV